MEESLSYYTYSRDTEKEPPAPKTNETRIVEALESIAQELFHIRAQLKSVTDESNVFSDMPPAIRTTGR